MKAAAQCSGCWMVLWKREKTHHNKKKNKQTNQKQQQNLHTKTVIQWSCVFTLCYPLFFLLWNNNMKDHFNGLFQSQINQYKKIHYYNFSTKPAELHRI